MSKNGSNFKHGSIFGPIIKGHRAVWMNFLEIEWWWPFCKAIFSSDQMFLVFKCPVLRRSLF
jgi:hypothetical protein